VTADLLERLYAWPGSGLQDAFSSAYVGALMEEAGDEIEKLREGAAGERERCARIAESIAAGYACGSIVTSMSEDFHGAAAAREVASAIRRGEMSRLPGNQKTTGNEYRYREGAHGEHCVDSGHYEWVAYGTVARAASKEDALKLIDELARVHEALGAK
jgi:hypothetical protein